MTSIDVALRDLCVNSSEDTTHKWRIPSTPQSGFQLTRMKALNECESMTQQDTGSYRAFPVNPRAMVGRAGAGGCIAGGMAGVLSTPSGPCRLAGIP